MTGAAKSLGFRLSRGVQSTISPPCVIQLTRIYAYILTHTLIYAVFLKQLHGLHRTLLPLLVLSSTYHKAHLRLRLHPSS
jgi:hypothetical protein